MNTSTATAPDNTTSSYSGALPAGLSTQASFDRVVWNGLQEVSTPQDAHEIVQIGVDALRSGSRTRFLARLRLRSPLNARNIERLQRQPNLDVADYVDQEDGCTRLTVGINTPARALSRADRLSAQQTVEQAAERLSSQVATPRRFTQQGLQALSTTREQGYSFDTTATPEELFALWGSSFGWTREQCRAVPSGPHERVFVLRDEIGTAIAAALYSYGETTEWSVRTGYQGKGNSVPLLLYSHCALLRDDIRSVFAELRWNRSISPGVRSGLRLALSANRPWLLSNHVAIGEPSDDPADTWNEERSMLSDDTDGRMLRSFVVARLDPDLFSDELMDAYLSHAN